VALTRTPCSADDVRALGRENLGGDAADAGTRAGDESDLFRKAAGLTGCAEGLDFGIMACFYTTCMERIYQCAVARFSRAACSALSIQRRGCCVLIRCGRSAAR
jgi:hypothetical protein